MSKCANVIYEPKGPAREYAALATNPFLTCPHGCAYCFAPAQLHKTRGDFTQLPALRPGYLEALEKELPRYSRLAGNDQPVHLGFVCDLAAGQPEDMTAILSAFVRHDVPFQVLTKDPWHLYHVRHLLKHGSLGVTITSLDADYCDEWEPGAPSGRSRMNGLCEMRVAGVPVWVSIEPVIVPEHALDLIRGLTYQPWFDGEIRVGRLNHIERCPPELVEKYGLRDVEWNAFALGAYRILAEWGGRYMLKSGLVELLPGRELGEYRAYRDAPGPKQD